ncbi:MAG: hypothetical protein GXX78_08845 [Bacteroidales bacterium]|nr:hypothetical protein [Bacteroidales bacterium]
MKKITIFLLFLAVSVLSFGQLVRNQRPEINVNSYPYLPLEHKIFNIKVDGLGFTEASGYTFEDIEKHFAKTQTMKYARDVDADYSLHIVFESPFIKNEGVKPDAQTMTASFSGRGTCNIPIILSLINRDGYAITEPYYAFKSENISGKSFGTEAEASKYWTEYIKKERDNIVKLVMNKATEVAAQNFQSKHDFYTYKRETNFWYYKPGKKFDETWENNANRISEIATEMKPGQTLKDYRDEMLKMIDYYDKQYDLLKNKNHKYCALSNITELYFLLEEFDKLPPYHEKLATVSVGGKNTLNHQQKELEEIKKRYQIYSSGKTIDAERIEIAKMKEAKRIEKEQKQNVLDSLLTKPSELKVYLNNNSIFEGHGYINRYRPTYENTSNIVELNFGRYVQMTAINSTLNIGNVSADDAKKIVAGEEVLYPILFGNSDNLRFTYLLYECPKIRVLYFKNDILLKKASDEKAEAFAPTLFGSLHKKLAEYFSDCPELAKKLSDKEIKIETRNDIIEIAKMYSQY